MTPKISLFASAARPKFWKRLYDSLKDNTVPFEIVFAGPNDPVHALPENFKFVKSNVKPSQCYQAASQLCSGEVIGWMADDCIYNHSSQQCSRALDIIWGKYLDSIERFKDKKTIFSMKTYEDYGFRNNVIWENHHFFYGNKSTPMMAPLGFINREWFNHLGGYDRNFICGQSENDIVMRGIADGGRVIGIPEAKVYMAHKECHGLYAFRAGYGSDRTYLQKCWTRDNHIISKTRLYPFESFSNEGILTENQGPSGKWEMAKV